MTCNGEGIRCIELHIDDVFEKCGVLRVVKGRRKEQVKRADKFTLCQVLSKYVIFVIEEAGGTAKRHDYDQIRETTALMSNNKCVKQELLNAFRMGLNTNVDLKDVIIVCVIHAEAFDKLLTGELRRVGRTNDIKLKLLTSRPKERGEPPVFTAAYDGALQSLMNRVFKAILDVKA